MYIVAQIFGIAAWLFFLVSYHSKNLNKIIFMQVIASLLYCINYFLVGAWTGLFVSVFEMLKEIGYYKSDKDKYIFYFSLPVYIFIGLISEEGLLVLVPIIASIIDGGSMLKDKKTAVIGGIISNTMWTFYDMWYLDYVVAITDALLVLSNLSIILYGYSKFVRRNHVYAVIGDYISQNTLKKITKLDHDYYDKNLLWDFDTMYKLYKKNPKSYILIKDHTKIIGYINILNLDKNIYDKMLLASNIYDTFTEDDILAYRKYRYNYLNINSIVLKSEYQNKDSVDKIVSSIKKYLRLKNKNKMTIKGINSFAVNDFESNILEQLGCTKIRDINNECFLYSLDC